MYKFFLNDINNRKGFTLTELLVVISIMSILVAVGVPIYMMSSKKQKINDCKMNCDMMETVIAEITAGMVDNGKKQSYYMNKVHANRTGSMYMCNYVKNWVFVTKDGQKKDPGNFSSLGVQLVPIADKGKSIWEYSRDVDYTRAQSHRFTSATYTKPCYSLSNSFGDLYSIYGARVNSKSTDVFMYAIYKKTNADGTVDDGPCVTIGDLRGGYRKNANMSYKDGCEYGAYLKKQILADVKVYKYFANEEVPTCPFDKDDKYSYFILIDGTVICNCPECLKAKHDSGYVNEPFIYNCIN